MQPLEKLRIDKYLWAIRIFKARSQSADACNKGKVKCNGSTVKPSKAVAIGDTYEIKTEHKKWIIQVSGLLHQRQKYEEAIKYYIDQTPLETKESIQPSAFIFNTGKRKSKQGRPTKKEKRNIDKFLE